MNILSCLLTKNRWYESGKTIPMTGIVVHSSGANNPELRRYVQPTRGAAEYWNLLTKLGTNQYANDWNRAEQDYGMHAFVGKLSSGQVAAVQTLPWNSFLWGCGSGQYGSYNSSHIQFEICEDTTDGEYTRAAYRVAAELCADLCREFNIPVKNIVGHYEAHKQGYASGHADPEHWWVLHGLSMDSFRKDVQNLLDGYEWEEVDAVRYNTIAEVPEWAKATVQKLVEGKILAGDGTGLGLTNDMIRLLVILDRAGVFDK